MSNAAQIQALTKFVNQRPGFDAFNYSTRSQYQKDYRPVMLDKAKALKLLHVAARDGLDLTKTNGRLLVNAAGGVEYITGQYFPTEYRRAVVRHLEEVLLKNGYSGDAIKRIYASRMR